MTYGSLKAQGCPPACRNGQIWNPGTGPYPCPFCSSGAKPGKAR
ncbi:hypothetical protein GCM10010149_23790 [Nonomuraea roseoviolacea subsp. roseoviolacea]|uniref:Uncharacterized protein n=1 Tax=Nonomuraea roseoviolacea subsp. carminata TaxID=160689 RepID=A0ABT1JS07_9ACTN|nr:hypothetical protein [Nonomuraea roseoviolacea subsp. carminata]